MTTSDSGSLRRYMVWANYASHGGLVESTIAILNAATEMRDSLASN